MDSIIAYCSVNWLALLAGVVNFIWVYLEYKASIWLWPVGIVLPILYIAVSWNALYIGNIGINIYYLITSIIGWVMWLRQRDKANDEPPITHVPLKWGLCYLVSIVPLSYLLYLVLLGHSSAPVLDAIATSSSLIGMLLLSQKHAEHWWCWIVANALGSLIFFAAEDYISGVVFSVNLVVSVFGCVRWYQLAKLEHS